MSELFLGLMSGTSLDAVDAVLVRLSPAPSVVRARAVPYAAALRAELHDFSHARYAGDPVEQLGRLDRAVGEAFADAALALLDEARVPVSEVAAVGSHGQTVRHRPPAFTLQIGDPNLIAARTGLTVVADFRRKDLALGGQGAPLMPGFHRAVFGAVGKMCAVVNIGGIANVTVLDGDDSTRGWDVGPGNMLMDAWIARHRDVAYDNDGAWAASADVDVGLLAALGDEPWFATPPPKSAGRELFNLEWLHARAPSVAALDPAAVQSTLCELTARAIADSVRLHAIERLIVCGGGARNGELMRRLQRRLPGVHVETSAAHGIDPDYVEAIGFAWLARQTLAGLPGNLPTVTGARRPAVLGGIFRP